jgi:S1-C subfamily serine protease
MVVAQPLQQCVVLPYGLQQQQVPHVCAATAGIKPKQQSVVACSNSTAMQPVAAHSATALNQSAGTQLSSAAAAAATSLPPHSHQTGGGSSSSSNVADALQAAQRGVVMVRVGRSWGSGVMMTQSGLVLTNAHLFKDSSSSSSKVRQARNVPQLHQHGTTVTADSSERPHSTAAAAAAVQECSQQQQQLWREEAVNVRLAPDSSSSSSNWIPARLLYRFQGYLDIAVLQLQLQLPAQHRGSNSSTSSACGQLQRSQHRMLQPLQLCGPSEDVTPGSDVFVIGHGLFGPGLPWPSAVTSGCAARVVALPNNGSNLNASRSSFSSSSSELSLQPAAAAAAARLAHPGSSSKPSMLITTAAVHGGASGGALVNARGQLVGLVTSNARHARGATLPHCNFCIAAAELRPLWTWAQQMQQQQQPGSNISNATSDMISSSSSSAAGMAAAADAAASAAAMLRELQALDLRDEAGSRLWALQQPLPTQRGSSSSGGGGAAAAVERLGRKLEASRNRDAGLHSKL